MAHLVLHFVEWADFVVSITDPPISSLIIFLKFAQFWPFLRKNIVHAVKFLGALFPIALVNHIPNHKILKFLFLLYLKIKRVHICLKTLFYNFKSSQIAIKLKSEAINEGPGIFNYLLAVSLF